MKQHTQFSNGKRMAVAVLVLATVVGSLVTATADTFTEPSTVVYGRVLGVGSEQPFLVSTGALEWTIRRADGKTIVLKGGLYPENKGAYSYRLDVPHEALATGLAASDRSVTLAAAATTNIHLSILVDGQPATILGPAGPKFDANQLRRAATYRMDLMLNRAAVDSDGDGIPDWWENLHGLDSQDNSDAGLDSNGDGLTNLDCYRNGYDPSRDMRIPAIQPAEFRAYRSGLTGIHIDCEALNVAPSNIVFELRAVPSAGSLLLRNAVEGGVDPDAVLNVGATFTEADVLGGRIVYKNTSTNASLRTDTFALALFGSAAGSEAQFRLNFIDNSGSRTLAFAKGEEISVTNGLPTDEIDSLCEAMSRDMGCVIWDSSTDLKDMAQVGAPSAGLTDNDYQQAYIPSFGKDRSAILRGGVGSDLLEGGKESDILIGGPGDDTLVGHGGGDLYVCLSPLSGSDTIEGFSMDEGDVLDISRTMTGASGNLSNYLSLAQSGGDSILTVKPSGTSTDAAPVVMKVKGTQLAERGLFDAVEQGNLLVGSRAFSPRVSLVVVSSQASENGPASAELHIVRRGDVSQAVTVGLAYSGTAENGTDYYQLPSSVTLGAGQTSATLTILPYADTAYEGTEFVTVTLQPGAGFTLFNDTTTLTIEDLLPQITVLALRPLAVQNGVAGRFSIRRSGVMTESVYVDLEFAGTAVAGQDYQAISDSVQFGPNVPEVRIDVAPLPSADLTHGKSLVLKATPASPYKVMGAAAQMMLVKEALTLSQWKTRYFPGETNPLAQFAESDAGGLGVRNIDRYAFGLDPLNPNTDSGAPRITIDQGLFGVLFRMPASVTDVNYSVSVSGDLKTWNSLDMEQAPTPLSAGGAEMIYYRSKRPMLINNNQFILMNLEMKP